MKVLRFNKSRAKIARMASGNTITALKYLRKLDEQEKEKYNKKEKT